MGVTRVSRVTSVTQTSTIHPLQPQHKVSLFFTSNPSLLIYIYRIQVFFSERNHHKAHKHAPDKSLSPTPSHQKTSLDMLPS
jgi:hypothetical protein